jgi:hypothetical protein
MSQRELWIGLVHLKPVVPRDWSAFDGGGDWRDAGAYSNIISWASSREEFRAKAEEVAADCKLYVVGIEEEEPLSNRDPSELNGELEEIVIRAESNPNAIIFGRFFTYPHEDA